MVTESRRQTFASKPVSRGPLQASPGHMVVMVSRTGTYHFRSKGDVIAVAIQADEETLLPSSYLPTSETVRVSHSEWGVLPSRQWLVSPEA